MADTERSKADLLTLLVDNITGDISPQDLRDFLVTVMGGYGGLTVSGGAVAQASIGTAFIKMTGWDTNDLAVGVTPDHTSDEQTIDSDGVYEVKMEFAFSGSANKTFFFALHKDVGGGFVDAALPRAKRKIGSGGDVGSCNKTNRLSLSTGDKLAVYVAEIATAGNSITPEECTFLVRKIG